MHAIMTWGRAVCALHALVRVCTGAFIAPVLHPFAGVPRFRAGLDGDRCLALAACAASVHSW
jgi:hypothetical protein